jgi:hypothetical protein
LVNSSFLLQTLKFSPDNIRTALVCSKCDDVFQKEFPVDLEGQTVEFKCPVCGTLGEADLPYKSVDEREEIKERLEEVEEDAEIIDEGFEETEYSS